MFSNKDLDDICKEVANETNISKEVVELAYREFWNFVRTTIESTPLHNINTEEECDKYRLSFNIPSLGKLYTTWEKISKQRKYYNEYLRNKNNENKET